MHKRSRCPVQIQSKQDRGFSISSMKRRHSIDVAGIVTQDARVRLRMSSPRSDVGPILRYEGMRVSVNEMEVVTGTCTYMKFEILQ